jgi:hypothetical protein
VFALNWKRHARPQTALSSSYQPAALAVGAAVAFGAGIYAFKGPDSVRQHDLFCARIEGVTLACRTGLLTA